VTNELLSASKLLLLVTITQLGINLFMLYVARIIFIALILSSVSPIIGMASDTQLAAADAQCRDAACASSTSSAKVSKEGLGDVSPSPLHLLLLGVALLGVRIVAKKLLPPKAGSTATIN